MYIILYIYIFIVYYIYTYIYVFIYIHIYIYLFNSLTDNLQVLFILVYFGMYRYTVSIVYKESLWYSKILLLNTSKSLTFPHF